MLITSQNVYNYFWSVRDAPLQEWVFVTEFTQSVDYIHAHESGSYFYYLSDRWSFKYEPRLFVAGNARGEDRSREFGKFQLDVDVTKGSPVFVLLGQYKGLLAELQRAYPGGQVTTGGSAQDPTFVAYRLLP